MKSEWVEHTASMRRARNGKWPDVDTWKRGLGRRLAKLLEKEDVERGVFLATTLLFFGSMYFLGRAVAETMPDGRQKARQASASVMPAETWGLGFGEEGAQPTGKVAPERLKEYNAYFVGDGGEKVIYLTFDCGYENGNTEPILDALQKHNAPATFFVVGHFLESAPELVKRMVDEGHTVGNHTYHHPDMSAISDKEAFRKEMDDVAAKFREVTGQEIARYYRPPRGKYSVANLQMAKEMGYATFFWSLAYVDWNVKRQPDPKAAIQKLTARVHPGAVVLLHNTSKTNGEILDELLTEWEKMGYTFGKLGDMIGNDKNLRDLF